MTMKKIKDISNESDNEENQCGVQDVYGVHFNMFCYASKINTTSN